MWNVTTGRTITVEKRILSNSSWSNFQVCFSTPFALWRHSSRFIIVWNGRMEMLMDREGIETKWECLLCMYTWLVEIKWRWKNSSEVLPSIAQNKIIPYYNHHQIILQFQIKWSFPSFTFNTFTGMWKFTSYFKYGLYSKKILICLTFCNKKNTESDFYNRVFLGF